MFTLLIKYRKSGRECLSRATSVEYSPGFSGDPAPGLIVHAPDDESEGITGHHLGLTPEGDEDLRDVFVMNEQGQTVARYVL